MIITIKRRLPSQNESTFGHWRKYVKERDMWYALIRAQLTPQLMTPGKMRGKISSYRVRLLDYGNLVGGAKPIPDALVKLGYLNDDSPAWFTCEYEQFKVKACDERTVIELEDA